MNIWLDDITIKAFERNAVATRAGAAELESELHNHKDGVLRALTGAVESAKRDADIAEGFIKRYREKLEAQDR